MTRPDGAPASGREADEVRADGLRTAISAGQPLEAFERRTSGPTGGGGDLPPLSVVVPIRNERDNVAS